MTDIVDELRQGSLTNDDYRWRAANEIERLREELNARCPTDAMDRGMSIVEAAVYHVWGERCPDFEPGCLTCNAWAEFDQIERLRIKLENIQQARVLQGKAIIDANNEIERLRVALQRVLSDIDFMVEGDLIPDIRNDFIYTEAHAALNPKGETE